MPRELPRACEEGPWWWQWRPLPLSLTRAGEASGRHNRNDHARLARGTARQATSPRGSLTKPAPYKSVGGLTKSPRLSQRARFEYHSMTFRSASVLNSPFDRSRMISRFPNGSSTTAQRPTGMSKGSLITRPPRSRRRPAAASVDSTKRSTSGDSTGESAGSVNRTSSVSDLGMRSPASVPPRRQRSSWPKRS